MLILNAEEVRRALPMHQTIAAMKQAYAALSDGRAEVPLRARLPLESHQAVSLFMPAHVRDQAGESLAVKIVSVFPKNVALGLPIIHAVVLVLEANTGRVLALLEGGALTAIRTGAGAGAAADLLARPESRVVAVFGAGVQARTQLEAVCTVRPLRTAWVFDPDHARAEQFAAEMAGKGPIPEDLRVAYAPEQALEEAHIICAATTSSTPVFDDRSVRPGAHINAVGSYTPDMQEIPAETVQRALLTVDSRSSALAETGDLIKPIQQGLFSPDHIHAEIGEIVLGRKQGRTDAGQITLFKSVGVAVQDALAGRLALENALKLSLGRNVDL